MKYNPILKQNRQILNLSRFWILLKNPYISMLKRLFSESDQILKNIQPILTKNPIKTMDNVCIPDSCVTPILKYVHSADANAHTCRLVFHFCLFKNPIFICLQSDIHPYILQEIFMTYPILLTLDLGSTTGWAISSRTGRIMSGIAEFKHRKFEGGGMCYLRFERWIAETHDIAGGFKAVYFRDSNITHLKNAAEAYTQFIKTLSSWCEAQSIPYEGVPVTIIKNFMTFQETTEKHEANALALMGYAREQHHIWEAI